MNFTKIPSVERNRAKQKRPPGSSRCTASSTVLTPGSLLRFAAGTPPGPSSGACPPHSVLSPCISAALLPLGKFFLRKDGYCHLPLHAQKYTPSLAFHSSISPWDYEQVGRRRWTQTVRFIYISGRVTCGILIPDQESMPAPATPTAPPRVGSMLTAEPLDKSLKLSALHLGFCSLLFCFRWPFMGRTLHQSYFLRVPILQNLAWPL